MGSAGWTPRATPAPASCIDDCSQNHQRRTFASSSPSPHREGRNGQSTSRIRNSQKTNNRTHARAELPGAFSFSFFAASFGTPNCPRHFGAGPQPCHQSARFGAPPLTLLHPREVFVLAIHTPSFTSHKPRLSTRSSQSSRNAPKSQKTNNGTCVYPERPAAWLFSLRFRPDQSRVHTPESVGQPPAPQETALRARCRSTARIRAGAGACGRDRLPSSSCTRSTGR
jgi:hypothetical protein